MQSRSSIFSFPQVHADFHLDDHCLYSPTVRDQRINQSTQSTPSMMTDRRKQRIIKNEDKPVLDSTIYPRLTKKPKSSNELPYRKLYNLEILNAAGTSYQSLEDLQTKGPFQARGSVPLEDTIRSTGITGTRTFTSLVSCTGFNMSFIPFEWVHRRRQGAWTIDQHQSSIDSGVDT